MITALWLLVSMLTGYVLLPYVVKLALTRRLLGKIRHSQAVCLTFDDGPDPRTTPKIVELLNTAGASATFFMLGRQAALHPQIVGQVVASGHAVGEHGFAHRHAWRADPFSYALDLLQGGRAVTADAVKQSQGLFRPAYGEINLLTLAYLLLARRRLVMWDLNPRDFDADSAAEVATRLADEMRPGRVVLLHDGRADAGSDPAVTVEAVRMIIDYARQRGLRLLSIPQALAHANS